MKEHLFISSEFDFGQETMRITDPRIVHQVGKVLRMKKGDKILLGNGREKEVRAEILSLGKKEIRVLVKEVFTNQKEFRTDLSLFIAILKKDRMEWLVEKATEVGVKRIIPINSQRTVKLNLRYDRLRKIALEAAEQSGRGTVPEIREKMDLEEALEEAKNTQEENFFFDLSGDRFSFEPSGENPGRVGVFVGPEGGWSEEEISLAHNKDFSIVKMSELTLRGETAGILASYLALFCRT